MHRWLGMLVKSADLQMHTLENGSCLFAGAVALAA